MVRCRRKEPYVESERMRSDTAPGNALTVGVIGTGNMGGALVRGWSRGLGKRARLLIWDTVPAAMELLAACNGVRPAESLTHLITAADVIVLVVKPKDGGGLLRSLSPLYRPGQVIISAMAGVLLETLREAAGPTPAVFRIMPNLGVELGAGMVAVSAEPGAEPGALQTAVTLLGALGTAVVVPEAAMDIVTAVSGTGPALLALAMEGLEDGGVIAGLSRVSARAFARAAMLGAARMLVSADTSAEGLQQAVEAQCPAVGEGLGVLPAHRKAAMIHL